MKKHRLITLILALCLVATFSVPALAACNNGSSFGSAYVEVTDPNPGIEPRSSTGSFSGTLSGEYHNYDMVLQGDYRYFQMTITNSGDVDIQVNVNGNGLHR